MKHRLARLLVPGVCLLLTIGFVTPAAAAPQQSVDSKKAEAARLQREIDANGEKISALAEKYDEAKYRFDDATKNVERVRARLSAARAESDRIQGLVRKRSAALYMQSGNQSPLAWIDVSTVADAGSRAKYAESTANRDGQLLDQLQASRSDLRGAERSYGDAQKGAQRQLQSIEKARRDIESANAAQGRLLSQVKGEIATLIKQEQERAAAAEKARSDAALARLRQATTSRSVNGNGGQQPSRGGGGNPGGVSVPNVPVASSGAAAAVAYAKAQLGKPYQYAATGPDSFDCSGLTMMAWAQGGVSMPHYSAAQGAMFPRVPDNALAPGDLVIYYPDQHHVAIYVGGGMTIAATHTGDFVRLQPVFRDGYQYAVRPG